MFEASAIEEHCGRGGVQIMQTEREIKAQLIKEQQEARRQIVTRTNPDRAQHPGSTG